MSLRADIDECGLDKDQCSQSCHNNVGSYNCSCETGNYRLNVDGHQCDGGSGSDGEGTTGVEREGARGTIFLPLICPLKLYFSTDINECVEATDECSQNCHNTIGSYTCSCSAGYTLNADKVACDGMHTETSNRMHSYNFFCTCRYG